MTRKHLALAAGATVLLAAGYALAQASPPAAVRTILQRADAQPGQEAIVGTVDSPEGAPITWHSHHGTEIIYVISGQTEITVAGQAPKLLKAGDSFVVPAGAVHGGHPVGGPAKSVSTWLVDKGKPLAEPAPAPGTTAAK